MIKIPVFIVMPGNKMSFALTGKGQLGRDVRPIVGDVRVVSAGSLEAQRARFSRIPVID